MLPSQLNSRLGFINPGLTLVFTKPNINGTSESPIPPVPRALSSHRLPRAAAAPSRHPRWYQLLRRKEDRERHQPHHQWQRFQWLPARSPRNTQKFMTILPANSWGCQILSIVMFIIWHYMFICVSVFCCVMFSSCFWYVGSRLDKQSQTESELTNGMLKLPQKHGNETTKKTTKVTEMVAGKQFLGKTPTR